MQDVITSEVTSLLTLLENPPKKVETTSRFNFAAQKNQYYQNTISLRMKQIEKNVFSLIKSASTDAKNVQIISRIVANLESLQKEIVKEKLEQLLTDISQLHVDAAPTVLALKVPRGLPTELKDELVDDIKELERCYVARCYKAATILCGRILETALHRTYYDTTGFDILEKNPGIGLGTLIAKLQNKNVSLDPALKQQIHLINQIRIFSVHKKKELFVPTQSQAHAMILYTMDVLGKLF